MKATNAIYLALAATVSASTFQTRDTEPVTLALSNDLTRSYATAQIATDGLAHSIGVFFAGSPVSQDGKILASSAQLATVPNGIHCEITNGGATIATLTEQSTYADLDGNPDKSIPVDLSGARVACTV
ncbi:hypothetical protein N7533_001496 [Penicillium manginii]|jgi:hypothetical protein|uniref:uncharacterized protein n=1 Tax=Penicillium manginii TaxID=203109 RepID=UPI0025490423|nr:uncharacterized protein N7533_001496 [Penicillium manginii]KAJ5762815.1 hypothetical protein N7533_001496 [Penicillium manginii]